MSETPNNKSQSTNNEHDFDAMPKLENIQAQLFKALEGPSSKLSSLFGRFTRYPKTLYAAWMSLHGNQKIYLISLIFLLSNDVNFDNWNVKTGLSAELYLVGLLALTAMLRELWIIFIKIWESMLGKSLLLLLYIVVANMTFAISGQKVNDIVGVAPSALIYSQGFTTIMMLPLWLLFLTIVMVTLIFIGSQFYKLFFSLLHLLHIHRKDLNQKKERFSKTFTVIRLVLLPFVIMTLQVAGNNYSEFLNIDGLSINVGDSSKEQRAERLNALKEHLSELQNDLDDETNADSQRSIERNITGLERRISELEQEILDKDQATANTSANALDIEVKETDGNKRLFDQAIAEFVYNFETYKRTRCVTSEGERVLPLNESDILVAIKDKNAEFGIRFYARECELRPASSYLSEKVATKAAVQVSGNNG